MKIIFYIHMCAATDVILRFSDDQQTSYGESDLVTVCASLSRPTERRVVAEITAQDGTATGNLIIQIFICKLQFLCSYVVY